MEVLSSVLLWCGSMLVYIGWLYGELDWRLYRYKKSLALCIGVFLWALLIIWLLIAAPVYNSLIILAANILCGFLFVMLVSEIKPKKALNYQLVILGLGFIGTSFYEWIYELGGLIFTSGKENIHRGYMLFGAAFCVVMQKFILDRARVYQRQQKDKEKQLIEMTAHKENMEFQEKQYTEMAEVYDELRRIRHDMRNSYMIIDGLLEQGRIDEAKKYLNSEGEALDKIPPIIQTDSAVISTLLNRLFQRARKHRVQISCKIITDFSGINERDLCHLLGNLLDNAVEAAIHMEEQYRYVDLVIQGNEHRMLIEIENSSDRVIVGEISELRTTKGDGNNHGLGLKNVRAIVEAYEGNMEIKGDGKRVKSTLILFRRL